ncbi:GTPase Era, mitochondrial [Leptopilina heterotoma]|uniref:GTPase Era, mitochondrial n=1 Tax=Leptopilina heterotoma TaxID=63436 RepID=UPI001CA8F7BA|nr:GTPase Era, mitochondrial [Leptopilina heterotoma]
MMFFIEKAVCRNFSRVLRHFSTKLETNVNNLTCNQFEVVNNNNISNELKKSLKVAIIGLPNAGKSTLINQLVNRTICPTSEKVHTTREKAEAILVSDNIQLIIIDTPGLVSNRDLKAYEMGSTFRDDVNKSLRKADIVGVVQDMENPRAHENISKRLLPLLDAYGKDRATILILNKIDRIKRKATLLEIIKNLTNKKNWPYFQDIFMISALHNDGVTDIRNYFLDIAKEKKWEYNTEMYTDQKPEIIVERTVRAKLMDNLPQEMPYRLTIELEHFVVSKEGNIASTVKIICPNERISKIVVGPGGRRVKSISTECEKDLSNAFRTIFTLKLSILFKGKK